MSRERRVPPREAELEQTLAALVAQAGQEPIPPRLRQLAEELEAALAQARERGPDGSGPD